MPRAREAALLREAELRRRTEELFHGETQGWEADRQDKTRKLLELELERELMLAREEALKAASRAEGSDLVSGERESAWAQERAKLLEELRESQRRGGEPAELEARERELVWQIERFAKMVKRYERDLGRGKKPPTPG